MQLLTAKFSALTIIINKKIGLALLAIKIKNIKIKLY
jgi:hypothetical protein